MSDWQFWQGLTIHSHAKIWLCIDLAKTGISGKKEHRRELNKSRLAASWLKIWRMLFHKPKRPPSCNMKVLTNCQRLFGSDRFLRDIFFLNEDKRMERVSRPTRKWYRKSAISCSQRSRDERYYWYHKISHTNISELYMPAERRGSETQQRHGSGAV